MKIKAEKIERVLIDSLTPHPKNMNKHSEAQIDRLTKLIEYQGMRNPIIVQKGTNLIVAGHGRLMALKKMGAKECPVIYQEFDSEAQLYAYMTSDNAIASWAELDLSMVNSEMLDFGPDFNIDMLGIKDFVLDLNEEDDDKYTRKVESPVYEIKGEKPLLNQIYDTEKTDNLIREIDHHDLPADVKAFLKAAAFRHTKFIYKNIAEFYAHASPVVQKLMEDSALVIIDYDKAVELGFVKLTTAMQEAFDDENP
jgi:hypothetical protein